MKAADEAKERYQAAPEGQKGKVAREEAAGIGVGVISSDAGAAIGAALGAPLGALGVIGGAIVGGFAAGVIGDSVGRNVVQGGVIWHVNNTVRSPDGSVIDMKTKRMTLSPGPKF